MTGFTKYSMLCILAESVIVHNDRATDISLKVLVTLLKVVIASVYFVFITHFTPAFEKWFISSIHLFA